MCKCIGRYISLYSSSKRVRCSYKQHSCDSVVLGTLIRKLNQYQLPTDSDTHNTINASSTTSINKTPATPIYHSIAEIRTTLEEINPPKNVYFDSNSDSNSSDCCYNPRSCNCPKVKLPKCIQNAVFTVY